MAYTTIDDPEKYFQVKAYDGTGSSLAVTLDGDTDLQPDMVWLKRRSGSGNHFLYDSIRGANRSLVPNDTDVEDTSGESTNYLSSFDSDGITLGGSYNNTNASGSTYVAWCWKANGTGSSNTDGTINTAATSANTTAGFSIVSYTGNASSNQTVGHGLGAVPHWILSKNRDNSSSNYNDWMVYHHKNATANDKKLKLNETDAASTTNEWGDTDPTSTVYSVHTSGDGATNDGTDKIVSYVWTSIKGFSKFGKYEGNNNADGPYVFTGFRPAFVLIKRRGGANGWFLSDTKRVGFNGVATNSATVGNPELSPNLARYEAEGNTNWVDIYSNGFKPRITGNDTNGASETYLYMAFAYQPMVNSDGIHSNAR